MNGSNFGSGHTGMIGAIAIAGAVLAWLLAVPAHAASGSDMFMMQCICMLGSIKKGQSTQGTYRFPRRILSRTVRMLRSILILILIIAGIIAAMWYDSVQQEREVMHAIEVGDRDLAPYVEQISKTAWFIPTSFASRLNNSVHQEIHNAGHEISPEAQRLYQSHLKVVFKDFPDLRENFFTYYLSKLAYRHYLDAQGELHADVLNSDEQEFRTSELISSFLRNDEISMERIQTYRDGILVIPYTMSFRTAEGSLVGSVSILISHDAFFKGFGDTHLKNLFVVDNEGHYLWHVNAEKRSELAEGRDSSFFTDYPEAYPDILSGRGERRVKDGDKYVEVRPVHVAFEIVVDGEIKKINTQNVSPQHYVWFIGYEEN